MKTIEIPAQVHGLVVFLKGVAGLLAAAKTQARALCFSLHPRQPTSNACAARRRDMLMFVSYAFHATAIAVCGMWSRHGAAGGCPCRLRS